jgi:restriction endonuclease
MYKFSFSYKSDNKHETIYSVNSYTYEDAILKFSQVKRLPVNTIKELFNIKRDDT